MGMNNLPDIVGQLITHGRPDTTPVALIRWGTKPEQDTLVGTLADIDKKATESGCTNPAVIIVGQVVDLREKLSWFESKPLFGKKVLVTRSREQASLLSERISGLGGEPVEFPAIAIKEPTDWIPVDHSINELANYQWVIFTSVNGVDYFFRRLRHHGKDIRALHGAKLCAIGPKTKAEMEKYGLIVDYVPEEYRAEQIAAGLRDKIAAGDRVLLPRAAEARRVLPEQLRRMGALVDEVTVYRTMPVTGQETVIKDLLRQGEVNLITFTSSSTVRNFRQQVGEDFFSSLTKPPAVACIGPVTADTAVELGLPVDIMATKYTIDGLIEAILDYVKVLS